jgi:hypothetical protein
MNVSPRIIFVFALTPGLLLLSPAPAVAVQPPTAQPTPTNGGDPAATAGGGIQVSPAVRAALGQPSQGAEFDPNTSANPGARGRSTSTTADQTYGPSTTTVAPDGSLLNGLQVYDPNLLPSDPGYADNAPDYHIVQRGDTLWDISGYYLVDPYAWPKLWSWNEHVTNAHWIFPGDRIRLYDPNEGRRRDKGPTIEYKRTALPRGRGEGTYLLNQVAFVDAADFETSMTVNGGGDAKVMMATLDTIYMDYDNGNPPIPGERLVVYSPTREVREPGGKKVIGYVVQIMGEVEIDSVARKAAEGTITKAVNPVERGYRVGPLRRVFRRIETKEANASATGLIVATLTGTGPTNIKMRKSRRARAPETLAGDQQFVVIDIGSNRGVEVGNVLRVVRKGDEYTPKRIYNIPYEEGWPRRVVGALLAVEVQENMTLAAVVFARRELEAGDHVELQGEGTGGGASAGPRPSSGSPTRTSGNGSAEATYPVEGGATYKVDGDAPKASTETKTDGNSAKGGFKFGK